MRKDTKSPAPEGPNELAALAQTHGLVRMGLRPTIPDYIKQTWQQRDFMSSMASYRMRALVEENRLGVGWFVLRPIFDALIYGAIFGVLQGNSRPPGFPAYVVCGVFLFNYFTTSFSEGAGSIVGARILVQTLAFPRATLPLARVLQNLFQLAPSMCLLPIILAIFGYYPRVEWLLIFPLVALFSLFNAGMALFAARVTVHLRDLSQMIPVLSRLLFYTSGVLFDVSRIFNKWPSIITVYNFHPLYQVLRIARGVLMGLEYPIHYWFSFSLWSVAVFILGLLYFWAAEERYGRE